MDLSRVKLWVVVPSYNEAKRLPLLFDSIKAGRFERSEIAFLIVEDGSRASEVAENARLIADLSKQSYLVKHKVLEVNLGKGGAIEAGFRSVDSDFVAFLDADASTSFESFLELFERIKSRAALTGVIASRIRMLGRSVSRQASRHYMGRFFMTVFNLMFDVPVYDAQCGAKIFRTRAILPFLDFIDDRRFVWDTQLVILLYRAGYIVEEFPVDWKEVEGTKVKMFRDPMRMFCSLWKFRKRLPLKVSKLRNLTKDANDGVVGSERQEDIHELSESPQ